ncbi:MAG: rod shape-determining protein MreD [Candidatus Zixiibacteriota bacterium]|nr:MAG: rod shape-determining protein MreD [candidate division Zixibacteria bacterium]
MIRVIPFLLYLWLIGLHQVILGEVVSVYGVGVNLPALMVLLVSIYKSELDSCWFGFFAGVVAYAGLPQMWGWYALILAVMGYLANHVRARINVESLYSRLLLVFVVVLIHNVALLLTGKSDGVLYLLASQAVIGAFYTTAVGWIFFMFKEGRITFQKFKAIF